MSKEARREAISKELSRETAPVEPKITRKAKAATDDDVMNKLLASVDGLSKDVRSSSSKLDKFELEFDKLDKKFGQCGSILEGHENRITEIERKLGMQQPAKEPTDSPKEDTKAAPANQPKDSSTKVSEEPEKKELTIDEELRASGFGYQNGPVKAYKFWDYKTASWLGPKFDIFAAKAAGNGTYEPIWIWVKDGSIDHVMTSDEIVKYCP